MKKIIALTIILSFLLVSLIAGAQGRRKVASTKSSPIEFIDTNLTLSRWYKQYLETGSGKLDFNNFLNILSKSEILRQRQKRAGLTNNQLYAPIVTLLGIDFGRELSEGERSTVNLATVELDLALSAIMATLVPNAHEEFIREVLRLAPPLTEVAKLPPSAVDVMKSLTLPEHKVSDRLNNPNPNLKVTPPRDAPGVVRPSNVPSGYYQDSLPTGQQ